MDCELTALFASILTDSIFEPQIMDFQLKPLTFSELAAEKCDILIFMVSQDVLAGQDVLSIFVRKAREDGDFETKAGTVLSAYRVPGIAARRLLLVGAGEGNTKNVQAAIAAALGMLKASKAQQVLIGLGGLGGVPARAMQATVLACADAAYVYDTTKPRSKEQVSIRRFVLATPSVADVQVTFDRSVALANGIALAKEWGNRPSNHATPTGLADGAKALSKMPRIKVEIYGPKEVKKLGMGAFAAVSQGSEEPLRFIVLRYQGAAKAVDPVVLVGKGITFDTGGISIKPAAEMDEMKFDMCGAASVLGTFQTLGELQPALNVIGLIPACENMPDGRAIKPGDVVTSMSGQTIEILNTDAEGRLVLCDALTYAERFKPRAVIDIATLTGACVVALGGVRSGLFSSNDDLASALLRAGENAQDLCWRMPLDDEYAEGLKTNFADVANVAGRAGGAVTAAKFLQRFTAKFPWAHLDIAGTAWKGGSAKGSTGRPVGLLVDYLLSIADGLAIDSMPALGKVNKIKPTRSRVVKTTSRT
jgi:leucyl aminopeptidase